MAPELPYSGFTGVTLIKFLVMLNLLIHSMKTLLVADKEHYNWLILETDLLLYWKRK